MHISKSGLSPPKHSIYSFTYLRSDLHKPCLIGHKSSLHRACHLLHWNSIRISFSHQCEINSDSLLRIFTPLFTVPFVFEDLNHQSLRLLSLRKNPFIAATPAAKTSKLSPAYWQHNISYRQAATLTLVKAHWCCLKPVSLIYRYVIESFSLPLWNYFELRKMYLHISQFTY